MTLSAPISSAFSFDFRQLVDGEYNRHFRQGTEGVPIRQDHILSAAQLWRNPARSWEPATLHTIGMPTQWRVSSGLLKLSNPIRGAETTNPMTL
jgi:hypothetical protein